MENGALIKITAGYVMMRHSRTADFKVSGVKNGVINTYELNSEAPAAPGRGISEETMVTNACEKIMLTGDALLNPKDR